MSHIPEDELHAYLDQAVGRSRSIEIESHLAECTRCRDERDGIAALRDRTTALLARLAPRRTVIPPYAEIRRRAQLQVFRQQRILARLAWAASVVLALGIGWTASTLSRTSPDVAPLATTPVTTPAPSVQPEVPAISPTQPAPSRAEPVAAPAAPSRIEREPRLAAAPALSRPASRPADGWRTVTWDAAPARPVEPPVKVPEVAAAPSSTATGSVVTRQLASGEVMRSIGGAPTDVSSLLSGRPAAGPEARPAAPVMPPAYGSGTLGLRQGGVAVGPSAVPSDSLRAMMRRLNLMLRVR
ncbi:MAG: zf-HC2 domain-containing protein [Gemmatimonadales bacterium]